MGKRSAYRVALLYHDLLLRDIVRHVLGESRDIQIVAELPVAEATRADLAAAALDVILVDRGSHDETLPEAVGALLAAPPPDRPHVRVIVLSLAEATVSVLNGWQVQNLSIDSLVAYVRGAEPHTTTPAARRTRRATARAS